MYDPQVSLDRGEIERWTNEVLRPVLSGHYESLVGRTDLPGGGLALLSADADRIKEYVFESAKLPEIRGASILLDKLNQDTPRADYQPGDARTPLSMREVLSRRGLPDNFIDDPQSPGCVAFAGGGGLLALVPRVAGMLRADIETLYPDKTGRATIACVWEPWEAGASFREAVERAGAGLRRAKEEKMALPFFESPPFVCRCDSCRWRPAVRFDPDPDGVDVARCRLCYKKIDAGRNQKSRWHHGFETRYEASAQPAADLEDIGRHSNGYIALLYADANGLGDWVSEAESPADYRQRSRAVHESVSEAVYEAIYGHLGPVFDRKFEVITIGGDDALLIVPAAWVLALARDICRGFAARMGEWGYQGRTMSAGVVIADHHTPVYFLHRIAEALLKSAKGEASQQGTADFLVLKNQSVLATDLVHLRSTEPWSTADPVGPAWLRLSHGPYSLTELDQLLGLVHQGRAAGFPRSQLYILRQALGRGRLVSTLFFLYQQARARKAARMFMRAYQEQYSRTLDDMPPWQRMPDRRGRLEYRTAWADLAEIWDFAREGSDAHTD